MAREGSISREAGGEKVFTKATEKVRSCDDVWREQRRMTD